MSYERQAQELFALLCCRSKPPLFPENGFRGRYIILRCLRDAGGEIMAGELARALGVTTGRIATAIKRLETMELVRKRKGMEDGRRTAVVLTEAGAAALEAWERQLKRHLAERLAQLTEAEADEYIRLTEKLL